MRKDRARRRRQLDLAIHELGSGRLLLLSARMVVGVNLLLVGYNLWRGWRSTDYYYLFILGIWLALLVVQSRIHRRRRARVEQLAEEAETRG